MIVMNKLSDHALFQRKSIKQLGEICIFQLYISAKTLQKFEISLIQFEILKSCL